MSEFQAWIIVATLLIQTVGFCAVVGTLGALQRRVHATQFEVTRLARPTAVNDGSSIKDAIARIEAESAAQHDLVDSGVELLDGGDESGDHGAEFVDLSAERDVAGLEGCVGFVDGVVEVGADSAHGAEGSGGAV